ncbi:MAG: tetratricopeptide repeat protein, partial [Burkholderiales bacterium]
MNAGRNDPCPCGSGMKYKKCCQNKLAARGATQLPQPKVSAPSPTEINQFVSLFNSGRHTEMENQARKLLERYPGSGLVWKALGASLKAQGKMALFELQRATELLPDDAEAHYNLANALKALGRLDDAVASYHRVLKFRPDLAEAHNNLGNALKDLGRLDDAVTSYHRALRFKPGYAEAHYNLANALKDLGRLDDAVASYHRALRFKPDFAETHSNLGVVLNDLGHVDDAETSYRRALALKPDYAMVLDNLALLLNAQGKSAMAMNCIMQSLGLEETVEAKKIFVTCVKHLHITTDNTEVRSALVRALTETWGRPTEIAGVCIRLIRLDPDIQEAMARVTHAWPLRLSIQDLFGSGGLTALQSNPLLRALLNATHVDDIETERFLTTVRCAMLEAIDETKASVGTLGMAMDFYCSLANQCFINEYVFSHTDAEIRKASDLRNSLVAALDAGTEVPALWPIAVATYFPLFSLPLATRLLDTHWPDPVMAVLVQQIREPEEER